MPQRIAAHDPTSQLITDMVKQEKSNPSLVVELILLALKLAFVVGFVAMVLLFFFGIVQAPDESMAPALREGDLVVFYRLQKDYRAGDVVVVHDGQQTELRRVIAVAGDVVDFSEDGLVINGYRQSEKRIYFETLPFSKGISYPVTVDKGQVFLMGDNRPESKDSRLYGLVEIDSGTEGEVMTVIRRRNF
ncbi:signal peptidase I [uncultured Olegusella sp.]|uniref:signal peptidase I n=1 Tax=uncultured Olegusella sp. TaxID=1979846 RepID=UPI00261C96A8|nr:signal peptidase I [uncultured Olegusella sp.]